MQSQRPWSVSQTKKHAHQLHFLILNNRVEGDRGAGGRENRGREGYGRREKKGWEAGSLRWWEAGEKLKKAVKETNPTTFLDFHLTFSEA